MKSSQKVFTVRWSFVRHLHYQRSKACSRHICSLVPTSLTDCFAEYEQRTLYGALVVTLSMLLRLINCRFIIVIIIITIIIFLSGETPGGSKITNENCETCLEVNRTLAGRHQRNHHAAKPNLNVAPQRKSVGIKTKMLEHPRSSPLIACPTRSRTEEHPC